MKKLLTLTLCILLTLTFLTPALAATVSFTADSKEYYIDKQKKTMDVAPFIQNGRTYLPARYIAEALNMKPENILWNEAKQTVYFLRENKIVILQINNKVMDIDIGGKITKIQMDVAPEIYNGRVVLPLRYLAQAFDINVNWDDKTKTVSFSY